MNNLRYAYLFVLAAPLAAIALRVMPFTVRWWPRVPAPPWLVPVLAVVALADLGLVFFFERQFLAGPGADRLKTSGQNPRRSVAVVGIVLLLSPAAYAFMACFMGLPSTQLTDFSAVSIAGLLWWGRRYPDVIWGEN